MFNRVFLILCGSLVAYTGLGYPLTADIAADGTYSVDDADSAKALLLVAIVRDYRANPSMRLADMDVMSLSDYANNSMAGDYSRLDESQRAVLARVVQRNAGRFPRATLDQFARDQQMSAGMTDPEIRDLMDAVQDIRNGNALTRDQAVKVRLLLPSILKKPTAFIGELNPITQYASMNTQLFTPKDLASLREASRGASGLTAVDVKLLMQIAQRKSNMTLTSEERNAIGRLLINAPIGGLNGLDMNDAIAIHQIVQNHPELFSLDEVRDFDMAYENNQAIMMQANRANQGTADGPRMDTTRPKAVEEDESGNQGMMNRQGNMPARPMIQQTPSGVRGNR